MVDVDLTKRDIYEDFVVPDEDVEACLKVLRTLRRHSEELKREREVEAFEKVIRVISEKVRACIRREEEESRLKNGK